MARTRFSQIHRQMTSILSPQRIGSLARALGVVRRRRKVEIVPLVYTLVLGLGGGRRTFASLRRAYQHATGTSLAPSAFQDRFTPRLAELMRRLATSAFERLGRRGSRTHLALDAFSKVFIADGSLVRLGDSLEHLFPSVWTNHTKASAKLHVVADGMTRTPLITHIVPGSRHDLHMFDPGPWCRGALLIFDLAYYQGRLFEKILAQGGSFLCRAKTDSNFVVRAASDERWVGEKTKDVLRRMRGVTFDCTVDYIHRNAPAHDWRPHHIPLRLVAVWHAEARRHRLYLTDVGPDRLLTDAVAAVYAMRWEIELLFRELKLQCRLDQMPSANPHAVLVLLYASLLTLALGRALHRLLRCAARGIREPFPLERWSIVFAQLAPAVLGPLLAGPLHRCSADRALRALLLHEAADPNRSRLLLRGRAQAGILAA